MEALKEVKSVLDNIRLSVKEAARNEKQKYPKYNPATQYHHDDNTALIDYEELNYLNAHWHDWAQAVEVTSHRKYLGKIILKAKRFIIDVVWTYMLQGYLEREKAFFMNMVRYLNSNARYIDNRDYKNFWQLANKVDNDISGINDRMDVLYENANAKIIELQAEIADLKKKISNS